MLPSLMITSVCYKSNTILLFKKEKGYGALAVTRKLCLPLRDQSVTFKLTFTVFRGGGRTLIWEAMKMLFCLF